MLFFSRKKHSREDGEATRRQILGTAVRLFAEHGYADTTSKMICREAGVNIAAVNYHFGSRDDLYRAVLDEVHEHIVNERQMELIIIRRVSIRRRRVSSTTMWVLPYSSFMGRMERLAIKPL